MPSVNKVRGSVLSTAYLVMKGQPSVSQLGAQAGNWSLRACLAIKGKSKALSVSC